MSYTSEETERWSRQMAEIEGWTDIRLYDSEDRPCGCTKSDHFGWGEDQDSPLIGKPPDEEASDWHLERYHLDLNALNRVCRKISEIRMGMMFLECCIRKYLSPRFVPASWMSQFTCLTPEELFRIIGRTTDQLNENKE